MFKGLINLPGHVNKLKVKIYIKFPNKKKNSIFEMKKINIAALYLILIREGTPEQKSANDVETGKQSSARQGLDSNFEGESSLG